MDIGVFPYRRLKGVEKGIGVFPYRLPNGVEKGIILFLHTGGVFQQ
jgi:hypothetical protein